ncbi:hypothetical protein B0H13DRAFT_275521 [Mycena leptocephala]|nr:hypothetical protein B0H13DRAFT_275521 [Mycena leptocephala]
MAVYILFSVYFDFCLSSFVRSFARAEVCTVRALSRVSPLGSRQTGPAKTRGRRKRMKSKWTATSICGTPGSWPRFIAERRWIDEHRVGHRWLEDCQVSAVACGTADRKREESGVAQPMACTGLSQHEEKVRIQVI